MQKLIETIVKPLVDYPEDVRVEKDETPVASFINFLSILQIGEK